MKRHQSQGEKLDHVRNERQQGAIFVLVILLLLLVMTMIIYKYNHTINIEAMGVDQIRELHDMEIMLHAAVKGSYNTLNIIADQEVTKEVLKNPNKSNIAYLTDLIYETSKNTEVYQQIRVLDRNGVEVVRVDRDEQTGSWIVPQTKLQDKCDRYYVKALKERGSKEYYLSPLDLNVEAGEVEYPFNPMFRLGKRIESEDGNLLGIMLLNISGEMLINEMHTKKRHEADRVYLLNNAGYYLSAEDEQKEFGFMFDDKVNLGFFTDHPSVWEKIQLEQYEAQTSEGIFFTSRTVLLPNYDFDTKNNEYYIVMHVLPNEVKEVDKELILSLAGALLVLGTVMPTAGWFLGIHRQRNKWYKEELLSSATKDELTGLYNRRMVYDLLEQMIDMSRRKGYELAVVFADVNNLKYVNDTFGHKMGDAMIQSAADCLKKAVRKTDVVARLGGDEFLIVLPDCSGDDIEYIMKRATAIFHDDGIRNINKPWCISFGYTMVKDDDNRDTVIMRADALMYEDKERQKSTCESKESPV